MTISNSFLYGALVALTLVLVPALFFPILTPGLYFGLWGTVLMYLLAVRRVLEYQYEEIEALEPDSVKTSAMPWWFVIGKIVVHRIRCRHLCRVVVRTGAGLLPVNIEKP